MSHYLWNGFGQLPVPRLRLLVMSCSVGRWVRPSSTGCLENLLPPLQPLSSRPPRSPAAAMNQPSGRRRIRRNPVIPSSPAYEPLSSLICIHCLSRRALEEVSSGSYSSPSILLLLPLSSKFLHQSPIPLGLLSAEDKACLSPSSRSPEGVIESIT